MKLSELIHLITVGTVIEFIDGEIILIGDASLSRQPTDNDGGVGWDDEYLGKEVLKIRTVNYKEVLEKVWFESKDRWDPRVPSRYC